jgi:hypothetical protein
MVIVHQLAQDPTACSEEHQTRSPNLKMYTLTQELELVPHPEPYSLCDYPHGN